MLFVVKENFANRSHKKLCMTLLICVYTDEVKELRVKVNMYKLKPEVIMSTSLLC